MESDRSSVPGESSGTVLGNYRLIEPLGEGGFGTVWKAEQREPVQRLVALKIIKLGMDTRQVVARFEAERQALALMDHPCIAQVYDAGATESGRPYFVMELVQGVAITKYCDEQRLSTDERLALFRQVCLAVQHAHQKGILHRDLKPSNVMVAQVDGAPSPKVIDFGIAKAMEKPLTDSSLATERFQVIGTPEYMSPEQASGRDVDTRADVYALGVMLYELLTGTRPLHLGREGLKDVSELVRQICEVTPQKPSTRVSGMGEGIDHVALSRSTPPSALLRALRGDLDWIVMRALEKDRERRYATTLELAEDVGRHLANHPVLASPPSTTYRLRKFVRRNRVLVGASAMVLLAAIAAVASLVWSLVRVSEERDFANAARESEKIARESAETALEETKTARLAEAQAREEAEDSLAESDSVTLFLERMLRSVDPRRDGTTVTVRQILDRSATRVDNSFADEPRIRARLHRAIGNSYIALGLLEEAEPHVETSFVLTRDDLGRDDLAYGGAVEAMASLRRHQARYEESEELFRELLEIARLDDGDRSHRAGVTLGSLALVLTNGGHFEEAEECFDEALDILRATVGEEDESTVLCLSNQTVLFQLTERFDAMLATSRRVYELREAEFGPEHPDTLVARTHLAGALGQAGRAGEQEAEHRAVLEIRRRILGNEHPDTLRSLHWIALSLREAGRWSEAEEFYRESLAGRRKVLGDSHLDTGQALTGLGFVLYEQGRLAEARPLMEEGVAVVASKLGDSHHLVIGARNNLAIVQYTLGEITAALETWERILSVQRAEGIRPLAAMRTQVNVAMCYGELGRYAEAEPLYLEAIEVFTEGSGPDHDTVHYTKNNLGNLYFLQGKLAEAAKLHAEVLETRERVLGPRHPRTMDSLANLAAVYQNQSRLEEALQLHLRALEVRRETVGPNHPTVGDLLHNIGNTYHLLGEPEDALRFHQEALELRRRVVGTESPKTLESEHQIGHVLVNLARPEEAEPHLLEALNGRRRVLGGEHEATLTSAEMLARVYAMTGREPQARPLYEQVLDARRRAAHAESATPREQRECAELLLECPLEELRDPDEALVLAGLADEQTAHALPRYLGTLAEAYAATGDSKRAIDAASAAIEGLPESSTDRADLEDLLESLR